MLLYPFAYVIINAVKSLSDTYDATVFWAPKSIYFGNFVDAFKAFHIKDTLLNTFVYEVVAALLQFCACAVTAYGLARFKLKGKKIMIALLMLNILVPSMMIIIPSYVNYSYLDFFGILGLLSKLFGTELRPNIIGSPLAFYLPAVCGVGLKAGLFIYIFMQFFKGLPKELEEAAWIDGASAWQTFLRIVLPSSGSASLTVLIFSVVWHWNDYYLAQMYMSDKQTLSVALAGFNTNTIADALGLDMTAGIMLDVPILLAGCAIYMIPMIVFYLLLQRKFVESIATSGIVG